MVDHKTAPKMIKDIITYSFESKILMETINCLYDNLDLLTFIDSNSKRNGYTSFVVLYADINDAYRKNYNDKYNEMPDYPVKDIVKKLNELKFYNLIIMKDDKTPKAILSKEKFKILDKVYIQQRDPDIMINKEIVNDLFAFLNKFNMTAPAFFTHS
jgi:hypothetical protein